jgi:3-oxoacyl-[acyl-carrier-protein] synthase II
VTVAAGFASGLVALLQGEYLLRSDRADVVLVVGVEQMSPEARVLLDAALTRDAECVVVLGDGAAAVVLERDDDAAARGAVIRAKILGSGTCQGDGYDDAPFLAEAIMECLAEAELDPADLSLVLSADCGLGAFRVPEGRALSNSLDRSGGVPRAAPKSRLGETYGAAGVLQLIAAIACIERGGIFVSPASWRDCAEVEAAVPLVVTQRRADVRSALTLAWGPREQCVAIAVGAP